MNDLFYCNVRQDMDNLKDSAHTEPVCTTFRIYILNVSSVIQSSQKRIKQDF